VLREKRRSGPDVWIFRWWETSTDGKSKYRKAIVGTVDTIANEASALKAAQALRIDANQQTPQADAGPIKLVRQSAKRERTPDVLELVELQVLLSKLGVRERTLALLDAGTGLRESELLALRWRDVNFNNLELSATRSIWHQAVGDCKTETSAKPVPLDRYMAEDLLRWRRQSAYPSEDDYIFASETMRGKQPYPYWPDSLMNRHIRPVAKAWHSQEHRLAHLPL